MRRTEILRMNNVSLIPEKCEWIKWKNAKLRRRGNVEDAIDIRTLSTWENMKSHIIFYQLRIKGNLKEDCFFKYDGFKKRYHIDERLPKERSDKLQLLLPFIDINLKDISSLIHHFLISESYLGVVCLNKTLQIVWTRCIVTFEPCV